MYKASLCPASLLLLFGCLLAGHPCAAAQGDDPALAQGLCGHPGGQCSVTRVSIPRVDLSSRGRTADPEAAAALEGRLCLPLRESLAAAVEATGLRPDMERARLIRRPGAEALAYPLGAAGGDRTLVVSQSEGAGAGLALLWEFRADPAGTGLESVTITEITTGAVIRADYEENLIDCPTTGICDVDCVLAALCDNVNGCMFQFLASPFFLAGCLEDPAACAAEAQAAADCAGLECHCEGCAVSPCTVHGPMSPLDCECAATVCAYDPFCCNEQWDASCVGLAGQLCPECGGGAGCSHEPCRTGIALDPATCPCAETVCAVDPFCCANQWDAICVAKAFQWCPECGGEPQPDCAHDPCQAGAALNPATCECAAAVCAVDPFCCNNQWDSLCVTEANALCPECP